MYQTKYPSSPLRNKYVTVKLKTPNHQNIDGKEIRVDDLWINLTGKSYLDSPVIAAFNYGKRILDCNTIPEDDEEHEIYGTINGLGYIVHESELDLNSVRNP